MDIIIINETNHPDKIAFDRGLDQGTADRDKGYYNDAPLSGEWAGESVTELLGDLFMNFMDGTDNISDLCDAYEAGYQSAFEN